MKLFKNLFSLLRHRQVKSLLVATLAFTPVALVHVLNYTTTAYALPMAIGLGVIVLLIGNALLNKASNSMKELRDCLIKFDYIDEDTKGDDVMSYAANAIEDGEEQIKNQLAQMATAVDKQAGDLNNAIALTHQGVSHQKTETEKLIHSMEEMLAASSSVSANAHDASEAANDAEQGAHAGQRVLGEATDAINNLASQVETSTNVIQELASKSENIGAILDVIKSIAEQTNLLALNAAIEAARAGEQGRGFAVVADEVRSLASRTQESTHEIEEMIQQLQEGAQNAVMNMNGGHVIAQNTVTQVNQANESISQITSAIERIKGMNTQIASAAEQQSAATQEIKNNVEVIDEVSELTVDTLGGLNSISEELQSLVKSMQAAQTSLNN